VHRAFLPEGPDTLEGRTCAAGCAGPFAREGELAFLATATPIVAGPALIPKEACLAYDAGAD
jgi:hypothetical protein